MPVQPLADEVQGNARYNIRCDGRDEIREHCGHLLSQRRSRLHRNYFSGKILAEQAACKKLRAVINFARRFKTTIRKHDEVVQKKNPELRTRGLNISMQFIHFKD